MVRESITISHIAPDADGNLKIIKIEDFTDSKAHTESMDAMAKAVAAKQ
jgi:hypothetical protein